MNELALFAGAGGGILGGHLLGWRTVCAVEWEPYPTSVLIARQNDGILPPFPIWDDVQTFDGKPWRGIVDVVSGGFPCQDISSAGKGAGIDGARSGMWAHMARIVREVRPRFVFVENSPMLTSRGLGRVLGDLAAMGFDAEWGVVSAADVGAPHKRDRIWIMGYAHNDGQIAAEIIRGAIERSNGSQARSEQALESSGSSEQYAKLAETNMSQRERTELTQRGRVGNVCSEICNTPSAGLQERVEITMGRSGALSQPERSDCYISREWPPEPGLGRVVDGMAHRAHRIKALGNGQVPRVAAAAFAMLLSRERSLMQPLKGED